MMTTTRTLFLSLLLCLLSLAPVCGQQLDWGVTAHGFFDNSEGDHSYRQTMTYGGMRVTPEVSVRWDERHSLTAGYSALGEWGQRNGFTQGTPVLHYTYQDEKLRFLFGYFHRDNLLGDYPSYLLADTIRYYRPIVQGFVFQHKHSRGYVEAFIDWTGMRTARQREQFMAGLSTAYAIAPRFHIGMEGYYYHYALTWQSTHADHIHDLVLAHPFVGWSLPENRQPLHLSARVGVLLSLDRERGPGAKWHTPIGFVGEVEATHKRVRLEQTFYAGGRQQPFGSSHLGGYYWGDTYTQAPFYSRTLVRYTFIKGEGVEAGVGGIFHLTKRGLNWHQTIQLKMALGSHKKKDPWRNFPR